MASHASVRRYFVEGGADEIVRLLRDLNTEQAALADGVSDALTRMKNLAAQMDELDPYYTFGVFRGTRPLQSLRSAPQR